VPGDPDQSLKCVNRCERPRGPQPDWRTIHRELRRKGVTLQLLWEEHRAAHPNGYGYSRFCDLYRAWEARLSPTMRQTHVAGERLFVDLRIPAPVAQMRHRTG
jgi:transposase